MLTAIGGFLGSALENGADPAELLRRSVTKVWLHACGEDAIQELFIAREGVEFSVKAIRVQRLAGSLV